MNAKLEKLLDRCNEMDITEQLNWLGDANMPYQAKMEYVQMRLDLAALTAELEAVKRERDELINVAAKAFQAVEQLELKGELSNYSKMSDLDHVCARLSKKLWDKVDALSLEKEARRK